jgi:hypothetical protein
MLGPLDIPQLHYESVSDIGDLRVELITVMLAYLSCTLN